MESETFMSIHWHVFIHVDHKRWLAVKHKKIDLRSDVCGFFTRRMFLRPSLSLFTESTKRDERAFSARS